MKARTIILTTSAIVALVAPAAHAGNSSNRLHQTQAQTVLYEQGHQTAATSHAKKGTAKKSAAKKSTAAKRRVVHEPLRPAPPVAAIIAPAPTVLLDGTYDSPNECIETSTGMVPAFGHPGKRSKRLRYSRLTWSPRTKPSTTRFLA